MSMQNKYNEKNTQETFRGKSKDFETSPNQPIDTPKRAKTHSNMGSTIGEALTCRINEALADCRTSTEKKCEEAGDTGKLLLSIITPTISAIASAITASVAEVMEKAIKEL